MTSRAVAATVGLLLAASFLCLGGLIGLTGVASACPALAAPSTNSRYDAEQIRNAQTIVTVGAHAGVPIRGQVIAIATALQESGLHNLGDLGAGNNQDSLGLFQQRPSQDWGTPSQIMSPAHAAAAFYSRLVAVPGWQRLPLTVAAQRVQRSATPDAYAKWEPSAIILVGGGGVGSGNSRSIPEVADQCLINCPSVLSKADQSSPGAGCLDGQAVLRRAATWLTAWGGGPVPYLSSGDPTTWQNGYRRDCSGYASMALGLPGPGLDGRELAARLTPILKAGLRPGDLMINPAPGDAGHVVIFDHWTDTRMTSYLGYEQSADGGTHHRVIPYPYYGGYLMSPYKYIGTISNEHR